MKLIIGIIFASIFFYTGCGQVGNLENKNFIPPTVKYQPKVYYPVQAQENSLTGVTKVELYVDREGHVKTTNLLKSSGYQVLDSTAEKYCRDIIFNPAFAYKRPIGIWVNWEVKFDIHYENLFAKQFVYDMMNLYGEVSSLPPLERKRIQEKILAKDHKFIKRMTDVLNFNSTIKKVLLSQTVDEWKGYWDSYPLSFLLYYDFIKRYPNYSDLPVVKSQMLCELKYDINFVKSVSRIKSDKKRSREMLLKKLEKFAKENSPDFSQMSSILAVR